METNGSNLLAGDKLEESLPVPRFDEETEASARPVVPLGPHRGAWGAIRRVRNTWPRGVLLALAVSVVVGVAAILIYRNTSTYEPSITPPTVSETIIKAVPEPDSLPPSNQPARARVPDARATPKKEMEPQTFLTMRDEPVKRDGKEIERRERDEEKLAERTRKEEKKQFKRQRKEAERLAKQERDFENSDAPKPRLVGIYTVRRKH